MTAGSVNFTATPEVQQSATVPILGRNPAMLSSNLMQSGASSATSKQPVVGFATSAANLAPSKDSDIPKKLSKEEMAKRKVSKTKQSKGPKAAGNQATVSRAVASVMRLVLTFSEATLPIWYSIHKCLFHTSHFCSIRHYVDSFLQRS